MSKTGITCLSMGVPPSKPKYPALTDSELVPWGKGEIVPHVGSEKDTEILGLQTVEVLPLYPFFFCLQNKTISDTTTLCNKYLW